MNVREAVLEEVADREGTDVSELPTLYGYVEVDALQSMVAHARERETASVTITFDYAGYEVNVDESGRITVDG